MAGSYRCITTYIIELYSQMREYEPRYYIEKSCGSWWFLSEHHLSTDQFRSWVSYDGKVITAPCRSEFKVIRYYN